MSRTLGRQIVVVLALVGCTFGAGDRGSGKVKTEVRELGAFSEIEAGGSFTILVTVGSPQRVEVTTDDNLLGLVQSTVAGGRLKLATKRNIQPTDGIVVKVVVADLRSLDCSGATKGTVSGVNGSRLHVAMSGASDFSLAGRTGSLDLFISGAGKLAARELKADEANVQVSGAGKVEVTATGTLDVTLSGAGKVAYWGEPKSVKQSISGAGALVKQ